MELSHTSFISYFLPVPNQISSQAAKAAIVVFKQHFKGSYNVVSLTMEIVEQAMKVAETHALRGYDAIQLATALSVQTELAATGVSHFDFVSADLDLNKAAQTAGLSVENPNHHL